MNKVGRHGFKKPDKDNFKDACDRMRLKDVAKKYNVSISVINVWRKYFSLTTGKQEARFVVWDVDADGCWNCTSHKLDSRGYPAGKRVIGRRSIARVMYEEKHGKIAEGLVIRHKCDNRKCVNPDHLEVGTQIENLNDAYERKRNAYGERHGNAKISVENAEWIKSNAGKISQSEMGRTLNLHQTTVWAVINEKTWKRALDDSKGESE
jgi:hypothetical protein